MTPSSKDIEQIAEEVQTLWGKYDNHSRKISDLEKIHIRFEGKIDSMLDSFSKMVNKTNCTVHSKDIEDTKKRISNLECTAINRREFDELKETMKEGFRDASQNLGALKNALWAIALLILAALIGLGVTNIYGGKQHQQQQFHPYSQQYRAPVE